MMRITAVLLLAAGVAACAPTPAPVPEASPPSSAIAASLQGPYDVVKGYLTRAAEQGPEAQYAFKATPEVRSMGQLFAHVADANYMFCGTSSGEAGPAESVEQTMTTKAELQGALAASFAFCDRAFAALDDTSGAAEVTLDALNMTSTKLGILSLATAHQFEHYGNVVTYMRLNMMVPPSSQPMPGM
jgi:uncharacterized damage-inducible protein DinB